MTGKNELGIMTRAYARWAPIYDAVYSGLLRPGRLAAARAAIACGRDILEVGVGTGLSLPDYPPGCRVTGVDLSKPMLDRARGKIRDLGLANVTGLAAMDACRLGLKDRAFDAVVGQYMITLVPDAEAALDEFARVLRPGGEIILVNKLGREDGPLAFMEGVLAPLVRRVGWSTTFKLARIRAWAARAGFEVVEVRRTPPIGTLIRLADRRSAVAAAA